MEHSTDDYASDADTDVTPDNASDTQASWTPDDPMTGTFYGDASSGMPSFGAPLNALGSGCVMSFMLGRR